jgi:hypothetical protein
LGADGPDRERNARGRSGHEELPAGLMRIGWSVHIEAGVFMSVAAASILKIINHDARGRVIRKIACRG